MTDITLPVGTRTMRAYLSAPEGDGPWPGVVVLHEVFGLNDDIRAQADRFASEGYLAVAPDLFSVGRRSVCIRRAFVDLMTGSGPTHGLVKAIRDWLAEDDRCDGRVGVIGFCMGGGFALATAASAGFDAAAVSYGLLPPRVRRALDGACPIVASYGRRDHTLPGAAGRLERTLTALDVPHDVKEYREAGHSFMTNHPITPTLRPLARIVLGHGYRDAEATDAWQRVFAFFDKHVR